MTHQRHPRAPATDDDVLAALRWAGLLSVIIFLVRNAFDLFVAHRMYAAQYWLIAILDGVLAIWAVMEVVGISRTSTPFRLRPLAAALCAQVAIGGLRDMAILAVFDAASPHDAPVGPAALEMTTVFLTLNTIVFLVIGKLLIDAFSQAERVRADQLQAQVAITKRAEAELRLQQQEVAAAHSRERTSAATQRRMLKLKLESSLMASAVAHEIKLPLSNILLRTRLALESGDLGPEAFTAVSSDAQEAVRTIEKMNVLLRSVETEHSRINLTEVVRTCLIEVQGRLNQQGVTVLESGLDRLCFIDGDPAQLRIAITNILRNAAEAIESDERGSAPATIEVSLRHGKRSAVLAIGDSGPGWSGMEHESAPLSTTKPSGSGLGLYVVRTVVCRNHRGKIAFRRSRLGGAELRLWFARVSTRAVPPANHASERGELG
jgi:signal transduction histidine kinase